MRRVAIIATVLFATALQSAAQTTLAPAVGIQNHALVATNDGSSFVIWSDARNRTNTRVYGSPLDETGKLTIPEGILLGRDPRLASSESPLALLPLGSGFLAIWLQDATSVRARRIAPDGTFADAEPATLVSSRLGVNAFDAATNGTVVALLTLDGIFLFDSTLQFAAFIPPAQINILPLTAAVASDGTDFLIAGRDNTGRLVAQRFTAGGAIGPVAVIDPSTNSADLDRLIWSGTDYVALARSQTVRAYRLDRDGAPIAPPIDIVALFSSFVDVDAAGKGNGDFVVVYNDRANLFAAFVSGGVVTETQPLSVSLASESAPSIVWDGTHYIAAWQVSTTTGGGIDAAALAPGSPRSEPVSVEQTRSLPLQRHVAATKSNATLVAWEEEDGSGIPRIVVSPAGGTPSVVSVSDAAQTNPAIAETPSGNALVAWIEARSNAFVIMAQRVDAAGHAVGSVITIGSAANDRPAVTHVDDRYLVAFSDPGNIMRIARVTDSGSLLDPGGRIVLATRNNDAQTRPVFTTLQNVIFLLWVQTARCEPLGCAPFIGGVKVDRDGNSLDSASLFLGTGGAFAVSPDAASNAQRMLVVWATDGGIRGRFVVLDEPSDPFVIAEGSNLAEPTVTTDGNDFLVAWRQAPDPEQWAFFDVGAARVRADKSVERLISDEQHDALGPYAFTLAGSRAVIAWPKLTDNVPRLTYEIFPSKETPPPRKRRTVRK